MSSTSNAGADAYLGEVFRLQDRDAVVIGGTSGLGAAGAVALARCGARVTIAGRSEERAAALQQEIESFGGTAYTDTVDVCDEASVAGLAERCHERHDGVDILLNAAGVIVPRPSVEVSLEEWRFHIDTNLTGTFLGCREFGRRMIEQGSGSIINFGSTDSFIGVPEEVAYCSSKGAVAQLTRTLGAEWIQHGVRVNAVGPSDFVTPMAEPFLDDQEFIEWQKTVVPIGRLGQPSELVGALLYLASEASSMVVGHTLMVDGGRTVI
ncbi:MAG: SDR family oxidoreductase [Solirubrobacterales bacterium]|nr:SDR family oxidoreductase [Solirubrobacterales bacterium]